MAEKNATKDTSGEKPPPMSKSPTFIEKGEVPVKKEVGS